MTGRGIDQCLAFQCDPTLYEGYVKDARDYVRLAERRTGRFSIPVGFEEPWGDALKAIAKRRPAKVIVNLETSITTSAEPAIGKGIHYKMHPRNVKVLESFGDIAILANNHVLDWGLPGLEETLKTLDAHNIPHAGAGLNTDSAQEPVALDVNRQQKVWVAAYGHWSSGVPESWGATSKRPGVARLPDDLNRAFAKTVGAALKKRKGGGDLAVISIHWGPNWGYDVTPAERAFAQALIDAGVDIVLGHSSHHPRPFEIYKGKLILYGCGDFLNDYEGISGQHDDFRGDLALAYFPTLKHDGTLHHLEMVPFQIRHFRLNDASEHDARWLKDTLNRAGKKHIGTLPSITLTKDNTLLLSPNEPQSSSFGAAQEDDALL